MYHYRCEAEEAIISDQLSCCSSHVVIWMAKHKQLLSSRWCALSCLPDAPVLQKYKCEDGCWRDTRSPLLIYFIPHANALKRIGTRRIFTRHLYLEVIPFVSCFLSCCSDANCLRFIVLHGPASKANQIMMKSVRGYLIIYLIPEFLILFCHRMPKTLFRALFVNVKNFVKTVCLSYHN